MGGLISVVEVQRWIDKDFPLSIVEGSSHISPPSLGQKELKVIKLLWLERDPSRELGAHEQGTIPRPLPANLTDGREGLANRKVKLINLAIVECKAISSRFLVVSCT